MVQTYPNSPIVLLTDFGTQDQYVGVMKGVICSISPGATIIDLTHENPPGDIRRAAITLHHSYSFFPPGTIFITVVDPGVGTPRQILVLKEHDQYFVGPDNGVFSYLHSDRSKLWIADNPDYYLPNIGNTFHGRDIFSPLGAHLSVGIDPDQLGHPIDDIVKLEKPFLEIAPNGVITGEVLYADHFGNLITSLGKFHWHTHDLWRFQPWFSKIKLDSLISPFELELYLPGGKILPMVRTFNDVGPDQCGFLIGSTGLIEIVAKNQSALVLSGITPGDKITIKLPSI